MRAAFGAAAAVLCLAAGVGAQGPTMPSTLRYGSGLLDIPVSSVLPHLAFTATYSGFFSQIGRRVEIDEAGRPSGHGPERDAYYSDGSVAVGLFDRAELGMTLQALGGDESGGDMWGVFGRLRLWQPVDQGLGLAVGARYVSAPSFGDGVSYAPGRLGFPDERLRTAYTELDGVDSELSMYAVATAFLRGYDGGPLPENDLSLTLGYGGGMFRQGGELEFYAPAHTNGWFGGAALHVGIGDRSKLTLITEHNGFDVNVGAQYDWDGVRIGAHYLATNHTWPSAGHDSEYWKPKFGVLASVAICPGQRGFRCRPRSMTRSEPDTVFIPPPPPDTVRIGVVAETPEGLVGTEGMDGTESTVCLSTGQNIPIRVTAEGDTLVGSGAASLDDLRPGLDFAGTYAAGAFWYQDDQVIVFEGGDFGKSPDVFPLDCAQVLRVGLYQGVPIFAVISARRPLDVIFVPVRPGLWHRYERGLR